MTRLVLVVDDDTDIREVLGDTLTAEGYEVLLARNGADALAVLRQPELGPPQLILLDLMMPIMSGVEFRRLQLADPTLARIPVVVISADGDALRTAADLGVVECLRKPVELDALLETVGRLA